MSSKQATSPFASVVDGSDAMSQEHLPWEKEESADAHGTPQLPLHSLLHGKAPDEMQPLSSVPPENDWDSLVSAQQRMVRLAHYTLHILIYCSPLEKYLFELNSKKQSTVGSMFRFDSGFFDS